MAMKVYGVRFSGPTLRVLASLNEKLLHYHFIHLDLLSADQKSHCFLSLNPFGQVPVLVDGDLKLFESRAIAQYIAQAYAGEGTPLISESREEMAAIAVWSGVEAKRYDLPGTTLAWELTIKPMLGIPTDEAAAAEAEPELAKILDVYEARLAQSKYLAGNAFSLADLHHLPTVHFHMSSRVKAIYDARPRVAAWAADILARPSWQKVLQEIARPPAWTFSAEAN